MSWPRTLWDEIAALDGDPEAQAHLVDSVAVFPGGAPIRPTMSVRAPCCGRRTSADAVWDLRGVPGTVVRAGGRRSPEDHDWLCGSACVPRMIRDPGTPWRKSTLAEAVGAPAEDIRVIRAKEAVEDAHGAAIHDYRRLMREGRPAEAKAALKVRPGDVFDAAME